MTEQRSIIEALGIADAFEVALELRRRTEFLATYLTPPRAQQLRPGHKRGRQLAVGRAAGTAGREGIAHRGYYARFIAIRLPYGVQSDERDALWAVDAIGPDQVRHIDIRPAADAMLASLKAGSLALGDAAREDFIPGNFKARQPMIAQFAICR